MSSDCPAVRPSLQTQLTYCTHIAACHACLCCKGIIIIDVLRRSTGVESAFKFVLFRLQLYIGQAGFGRKEDIPKLGLQGHSFCMGGPAVIFSRPALQGKSPMT